MNDTVRAYAITRLPSRGRHVLLVCALLAFVTAHGRFSWIHAAPELGDALRLSVLTTAGLGTWLALLALGLVHMLVLFAIV